ncbi:3-deoxy-manno-octulosonate cytidylyltransferase [Pluralibacter sp.]|jgi:3-deoxy-manno-octulosonate cytidylyltransferase (CMP-KDO synthetase)|uniref:3-deoxy-manno-octulosonate cytidylyltransferase n=1 Tax=Pluralibacter sp. TaxID=1920032 RepID=UPI0025F6AD8B|nr:3-deoxy-manno-octulosonate cytidylyltransferase [Pluralibacter sp.]MBV8041089.1 3-deoxy-manno-octulosonate cytidylyltransferase [Pluralibacter sp.]
MNYKIVIPARYGSSRLPGKPLALIGDQPMIQHVWQRAVETGLDRDDIWVATDDERVAAAVRQFGGNIIMTRPEHNCGTDRLAEVAHALKWAPETIVVNVQGDEPLLPARLITLAAKTLATQPTCGIATLATPIDTLEQVMAPQCVKVVLNKDNRALYFSRAPIPWDRDGFAYQPGATETRHGLRHIGLYAYRVDTLLTLGQLPTATIEQLESLEQLRALWHGIQIAVATIDKAPPHGVDTPEDLEKIRSLINSGTSI